MTPENFAFWLQGFFELADTDKLTETQVKMVKDHLALVFQKVTPDRSKKTKKKRKISPLEAAARAVDFEPFSRSDVTSPPAVNSEQIRINAEDALKRLEQARRERQNHTYRTTCTWVGGGRDQTYC